MGDGEGEGGQRLGHWYDYGSDLKPGSLYGGWGVDVGEGVINIIMET